MRKRRLLFLWVPVFCGQSTLRAVKEERRRDSQFNDDIRLTHIFCMFYNKAGSKEELFIIETNMLEKGGVTLWQLKPDKNMNAENVVL